MSRREISFDFDSVHGRADDESVKFHPIDALIGRDQDLTVRYTVGKRFRPKTGDWIGLFQLSRCNRDTHLYVGFCWARKHGEWKARPLERAVEFKISEFGLENLGKDIFYQFVYVTSLERLMGSSNVFQIRMYVPIANSKKDEPSTAAEQKQTPCLNSVVPYEFFHQPQMLLHLANAAVHLCYEDLTAASCRANSTKYPTTFRFMATRGLKDWSQLTFHLPHSGFKSCSSCQIAIDVIRTLRKRLHAKKQEESNRSCCSQKEFEALKDQVDRLKKQKMELESALFVERLAKFNLLQSHNQLKQGILKNFGMIASMLHETQLTVENVTESTIWTQQTTDSKPQMQKCHPVILNQQQACTVRTGNKSPVTDDTSNNREHHGTKECKKNSSCMKKNAELFANSTDHDTKKPINHNRGNPQRETYTGTGIPLDRPYNGGKDKVVKNYSGSSISLKHLFADCNSNAAAKEQPDHVLNQYSGSNIALRHLFHERSRGKIDRNTYSGSNIALSYLFQDDDRDDAATKPETGSSFPSCYCHCIPETGLDVIRVNAIDVNKSNEIDADALKTQNSTDNKKPENAIQCTRKRQFTNDRRQTKSFCDNQSDVESRQNTVAKQKKVDDKLPTDSHKGNISNTSAQKDVRNLKVISKNNIIKENKSSGKSAKRNAKEFLKSKRSLDLDNSNVATKDTANAQKKNAKEKTDGKTYKGGVLLPSNYSTNQTKPFVFPSNQQTTDAIIPPSKSLTVSIVTQTDRKQETPKQTMVAKIQAEVSRDAKSVSSLGRPAGKGQGNDMVISSNPVITTNTGKLDENPVVDSQMQRHGCSRHPASTQVIQTVDLNNALFSSEVTLIKDTNIITIPTTISTTAMPELNAKINVTQKKTDPPQVITGYEQNKKRKKRHTAESSASIKKNSTDVGGAKDMALQNVAPDDTMSPLSKSFPLSTTPNESVATKVSVKSQQPVVPTSPTLVGMSDVIQSSGITSQLSPAESTYSAGTTAGTGTMVETKKELPRPFLTSNSETVQAEPCLHDDNEYPLLPSVPRSKRETKSYQDRIFATSYASVTKQDPQPVIQKEPNTSKHALQSLAKLAEKVLHKYRGYQEDEELESLKLQDTYKCTGGKCQSPTYFKRLKWNIADDRLAKAVKDTQEHNTVSSSISESQAPDNDCQAVTKPSGVTESVLNSDHSPLFTRDDYLNNNVTRCGMQETVLETAPMDLSPRSTQYPNKTQSNGQSTKIAEEMKHQS